MPELDQAARARLDDLERAIDARDRLDIRYRTENGTQSDRVIRPLGLWFWGKVCFWNTRYKINSRWYVARYRVNDRYYRSFRC